ncbi:BrnA antitoxin family protein [Bosea sp. PAMC 26642]|uniref:BrnA antitoxin family protein n=1 Tax=Bosea sp. (strain PAMC 26642) TaxID=1792307 RepID=UPI0007705D1D|nr:BrnA antitoxin family protein [Bosea sp. PAMC 26642]AMJ62325.1 hypothetical protein AXW83_20280 [Bosea sp. PAMC 26642]
MTVKELNSSTSFVDPDDGPEWTDDQFARAEFAIGGKIIRPAQGTLTRGPGRPKLADAKQVVTLRLEPSLIEAYKNDGEDWRGRMADAIRKAAGRR